MTSCMSSKRSNHLGYASKRCLLYHIILQIARGLEDFFQKYFKKHSNHNHPSNGWYAQGLKAQYYRPAAQAADFRILKPIAFATFAALERAFVLLNYP